MIFFINSKKYAGKTAVKIVRSMEGDAKEYENRYGNLKDFILWSLEGFADSIPLRELDVGKNLSDEKVALNYLCILDTYKIGKFFDTRNL